MGFSVEQECPQCGAPIELDETDRLFRCPYCGVKSMLFAPDYFRYILPNMTPDRDIIYAPYLRFKGSVFFCRDLTTGHRIVDITHPGLVLEGLPVSLGLRPQAMKLRYMNPGTEGTFLRFSLKASDILSRAARISPGTSGAPVLHRAFIGETMSLIYFPLYLSGDMLVDAVINRPVAGVPGGREGLEPSISKKDRWDIAFIPTLCPACGWDLKGDRDSVVLLCENCETAWDGAKGRLNQVECAFMPGRGERSSYLPFWKITANAGGLELRSFADFIRITNQPVLTEGAWEEEEMSFWSPAFKIRPRLFLSLARNLTVTRKRFKAEEGVFPEKKPFPVTLPASEAAQALKIILAVSAANKRNIFPHLPRIRFEIKDLALVYLPFDETGHDMIQQDTGISVNKRSLVYGRTL